MDSRETRPPWASLRARAVSGALRAGPFISERALLRSSVRVSGLMETSSDLGTTFRQTILCRPPTLSTTASLAVPQGLDHKGEHLRDVVDNAVVGRLENGGLRVGVDGDDGLGV